MKKHIFPALALIVLVLMVFGCDDGKDDPEPGPTSVTKEGSGEGYRPAFPIKLSVTIKDGKVESYEVLAHNESTGTGFGYNQLPLGTPVTADDHSPVGIRWPTLQHVFDGKPITYVQGLSSTATGNTAAAATDVVVGATYSYTGIAKAIEDAFSDSAIVSGSGTAIGTGTGYSNRNGSGYDIEVEAVFSSSTITSYTITKHNESSGTGTGYGLPPVGTPVVASLRDSGNTHMQVSFPVLETVFIGKSLPITTAVNSAPNTPHADNTAAAALDGVSGATLSWTGFADALNDAYSKL